MLSVFKCNLVGRSCGGQGNRTPQAASSRPTLRRRAQYPHQECPPKPRPQPGGCIRRSAWIFVTFITNHQIPFLIWEADKCLVVNADGRAREIAPLSFLRESRFSRGVKIPTLRKPRRAGQPAACRRSRTARRTQQLMDRDTAQRHAPQQSRTRGWMPDTYLLHLHAEGEKCFLLTSPFIEPGPERASLAVAIQMLKQIVSYQLHKLAAGGPFWQARYYDFNVWSERKRIEKLRYIHRNPVKRGLVESPEQAWSSFRHY